MNLENEKILITGGTGMVGTAFNNLIPSAYFISSEQCDMRYDDQVERLFRSYKPNIVIHLAAKVGGIKLNMNNPVELYSDNILINNNILKWSEYFEVEKVISLLSTCIYPDSSIYPLTEEQIHNGEPHSSNFAYAFAKRMLDVQSRAYRNQYGCNFITAVPNNIFGIEDNYHLENSHVIPAITRKIWEAKLLKNKTVELWGSGNALREFTTSNDVARILLFLLENYDEPEPINIGNTKEYSIKNIAKNIKQNLKYDGKIIWNKNQPSGQFRKPSSNKKLMKLVKQNKESKWFNGKYENIFSELKNVCEWFEQQYPDIRGYE